ncbi:hypothetical protein [Bartonella australis]|uniref:hypothetical protein n=1 Tax=Bartonella australis TaxID=388640 RepID=UPI00034C86E5|nr:hypothetical protein [Bartonella australis]
MDTPFSFQFSTPLSTNGNRMNHCIETIDRGVQINQLIFVHNLLYIAGYLSRKRSKHNRQLSFVAFLGTILLVQ